MLKMKLNAPWIEVVKKQKGPIVDKVVLMNPTLDEESKKKV
jgi:hypothetical protein